MVVDLYQVLLLLHLLCFVYWLGGDLGVYYASGILIKPGLSQEARTYVRKIMHWLDQFVERRLAARFGWSSVMWTGWLGTPVHELSHAIMCLVFRHRIDELVLFRPDPVAGRLGYVRHSFRKHDYYEEIGNLFIGVAPLFGGALVLTGLTGLFYPATIRMAWEAIAHAPDGIDFDYWWNQALDALGVVFAPREFAQPRLWVFVYLVTCVTVHIAPSPSDYEGASRGVLRFVVPVVALVLVLGLFTSSSEAILTATLRVLNPVFVVLLLSCILCAVAAAIVFLVTLPFPVRYEIRQ